MDRRWITAIAAVLALSGCVQTAAAHRTSRPGAPAAAPLPVTAHAKASSPNPTLSATGSASSPQSEAVVAGDNALGFALLAGLVQSNPGGNVLLSPPSLAFNLAMVYNGAGGATKEALARVLGVGTLSAEEINTANAAILGELEHPGQGITLDIADSLWSNDSFSIPSSFVHTSESYYQAQVYKADFANPVVVAQINAWVSAHTGNRIPTMLQTIPGNTVLMLLNALYFHGSWAAAFDSTQTRSATFTSPAGSLTIPMMSRTGLYAYGSTSGVQVVSLPYAGDTFRMDIILPQPGSSLPTADLGTDWSQWTSNLRTEEGTVELPRFTISYSTELESALQALGMGLAFSSEANLQGICGASVGCQISTVEQKTYLSVDEQGTTAAAATGTGITITAVMQPVFTFVANRPFLCAIVNNHTGMIVFLGAVVKP